MTQKRALITGITGQDGFYLSKFLLEKGYEVYGLVRRSSHDPFVRYKKDRELLNSIHVIYGNMRDEASLRRAIDISKPDEVYNLAALSDVGISFQCPDETFDINYNGVGKLFSEALRANKDTHLYQASTSEMFGSTPPPQNEVSVLSPVSPYAEAKVRAHQDFVVSSRNSLGAFVCSGILFNHESPHRGENFVTRKITMSLAKIAAGKQDVLELGNIKSRRDWGFAGDYVKAMWLILQQPIADDFVISSGENHSVKDFVDIAARMLSMDIIWEGEHENEVGRNKDGKIIVKINPEFYRPAEVHNLLGDSTKARSILGWKPEVSFESLVEMMVKSDVELVSMLP